MIGIAEPHGAPARRLSPGAGGDLFHSPGWRILVVFLLAGFLGAGPMTSRSSAELCTIVLKNGMQIKGDLLREKPDVILVDLGFTVLTVPTQDVERVVVDDPTVAVTEEGDLFRVVQGADELSVEKNVNRCSEAVVEIRTSIGLGSGMIINPDGYVLTNDHVVAGEHKITVTVFEKRRQDLAKVQYDKVRIVANDPFADLSLLQIEELDEDVELPWLPLGDSDQLFQGQSVFAIGSPLGLERSVAEGIVSIRNRPIYGRLYIQSTTQINPGNSGGPLINLRGEVIGVINAKIAALGVEGMSFAVPVNVVKQFLRNRDSYAFDRRNPNSGFRYLSPPDASGAEEGAQ